MVRLLPQDAWMDLDHFKFEDFLSSSARFQFKTTAIWEEDEEGDKEPWERKFRDEDEIDERPCIYSIDMSHTSWVRVIYRVDGEIPTPGH